MVTYTPDASSTTALRRVLHQRSPAPDTGNEQPDWLMQALCASVDPEVFYPFDGGSPREALAICERCPVVAECLALALKMEADGSYCFGVWGGKSANQRRQMIRASRGETCPSCGYPFRDLARHRQMSLACHLVAMSIDTEYLTVDEPVTYTSVEVCQLAGISYRQLDWWCRHGWLTDTAHGSGSQRRFDKFDLQLVRVTAWLQTQDIPVKRAVTLAALLLAGGTHRVTLDDDYELLIRPASKQPL